MYKEPEFQPWRDGPLLFAMLAYLLTVRVLGSFLVWVNVHPLAVIPYLVLAAFVIDRVFVALALTIMERAPNAK
jgi:hypothetical protein